MASTTGDDPRPDRAPVLGRAAVLLGVVAALAVAAAALGEPADRGRSLLGDMPWPAVVLGADVLLGALLTAGALLALAAAWAVATTRRRQDFRSRPWWHVPVTLGLLAAVVLVVSWMVRRGLLGEPLARIADLQGQFGGRLGEVEPGGEPAASQAVDAGLRRAAVLAGAVLVVAGGLLLALRRGLRGDGTREQAHGTERVEAALSEAVDAALDDLDAQADPRAAVLRCYAHLEAALAAAGCPRRRAETAREHRRRAVATLGPAARAAARLVDRFEHARYDAAPVGEADRAAAVAALGEIRAALDAARPPAGPAGMPAGAAGAGTRGAR